MKRASFWLLAVAILVVAVSGTATLFVTDSGPAMTTAAQGYLASLTPQLRDRSRIAFDDPKRLKWHFIPLPERKGLQIKDMNDEQRKHAHALLEAGLSQIGYHKATTIMSLEAILRELESSRKGGPIRDPERYYFTVFGDPSPQGRWGWSVEGHHLSLNFTLDGNHVASTTPSFFGANPATVHSHAHPIPGAPSAGTRVLAKEEDLGFQLLKSFDPEQRKTVVLAEKSPRELRGAGDPQPPQTPPAGLPASKMNDEQRKLLRSLIEVYTGNMRADVAQARLAAIDEAGMDKVHFAWEGADRPGIGHYYRVQGPSFVIEFVNSQPDSAGNPANHIHSLWRDMRGDFGLEAK